MHSVQMISCVRPTVLAVVALAVAIGLAPVTVATRPLVSFRLAVTVTTPYSGRTPDTCSPLLGGRGAVNCTGGAPDADLAARMANADLPAALPPMAADGAPPPAGTAADLVEVRPLKLVASTRTRAACAVLQAVNPTAIVAGYNVLRDGSGACATLNRSISLHTDWYAVAGWYTHLLTDDGLLLMGSTQLAGRSTIASRVKTVTTAVRDAGVRPVATVLLATLFKPVHLDELLDALAASPPALPITAIIVLDNFRSASGGPRPSLVPAMRNGIWTVAAGLYHNDAAGPQRVGLVDLTVAAPGSTAGFASDLRVRHLVARLPVEVRTADAKWRAAEEAVAAYRAADPAAVLGVVRGTPPDYAPDNGCRDDDCYYGQLVADGVRHSPGPAAASLDGPVEAAAVDASVLAAEPADIGVVQSAHISRYGTITRVDQPLFVVRSTAADELFGGDFFQWVCRGALRGLTLLRIADAGLRSRGSGHFLQWAGLRFRHLPANATAGRRHPTVAAAEVRNSTTGVFEPLDRTRLYTVATTRSLPIETVFEQAMEPPLRGESMPCHPWYTKGLGSVVSRVFAARGVEQGFAVVPATKAVAPGEEEEAAAAAAALADGKSPLLVRHSAATCAAANAASPAGAGLLHYAADLQSCEPCRAGLIPSAAADDCVAPPPPPVVAPPSLLPQQLSAVGAVLLALLAGGPLLMALRARWRRRHLPKDDAVPFTVAYVSTLNEAVLRERHPDGAAEALRLIERTVAREAAAAGCVVARRLEAHHMIVAKDPARALRCAAAVLRALSAVEWVPVLATSTDEARRARLLEKFQARRGGGRDDRSSASGRSVQRSSVASFGTVSGSQAATGVSVGGAVVAPEVAAGLWHGPGTVEVDAAGGEAFGHRFGGPVATAAAAAAIAARPWEVVVGHVAAVAAEAELWAASGGRTADCDDCEAAIAAVGHLAAGRVDNRLSSDSGEAAESGSSCGSADDSPGSEVRVAPPQLGVGVLCPVQPLPGLPAAASSSAGGSRGAAAVLLLGGLRWGAVGGDSAPVAGSHRQSGRSTVIAPKGSRAASGAVAGANAGLASALCAADGVLATHRVGVVCVYVPALRATLTGVTAETSSRLFDSSPGGRGTVSPDDILDAALGAAAHSRLVALLDGCLFFAINAPDVTTAQVPARAAQDALAVTDAVREATGALAFAGVAVGAALVGQGKPTAGETNSRVPARSPPVVVLGTAADRAQHLAFAARVASEAAANPRESLGVGPVEDAEPVPSPKAGPDASGGLVAGLLELSADQRPRQSAATAVVVAGDLAAELASFELQVVDIVAWPSSVTALSVPPTAAAGSAADVRARVALAVRVVADRTDDEVDGDGDGEWLYKIGAVGGGSPFSAVNAAAARLVQPLGVVADFASGGADGSDADPLTVGSAFAELRSRLTGEVGEDRFAAVSFACARSAQATLSLLASTENSNDIEWRSVTNDNVALPPLPKAS